MWRIFQLNKHLTRPGHPWSKFGTGSKVSLTEAARSAKSRAAKLPMDKPSLSDLQSGASPAPSPIPSRIASPAPSVNSTNSENDADGGSMGRETRRRLIEWWSKEYGAERMTLTIVGKGSCRSFLERVYADFSTKDPLDELTRMATLLFSPIQNRGQDPTPLILEHPFGQDERGVCLPQIRSAF